MRDDRGMWVHVGSARADENGKFLFEARAPRVPGKYRYMATVTDKEGKVIAKSGIVEVYVRKPSGRCPQCGEATYPTGGMKRVPFSLEISASSEPLKKEWRYENEHQCTRCRRKFGVSQIES